MEVSGQLHIPVVLPPEKKSPVPMYTKYLRSNLPDEINTNVQEKDVDT
jgi:hypothetical protein